MSAVESAVEAETPLSEHERVTRWRVEELLRAGYDGPGASLLAARLDVDLHLAVDLVRRGCPSETALRILL